MSFKSPAVNMTAQTSNTSLLAPSPLSQRWKLLGRQAPMSLFGTPDPGPCCYRFKYLCLPHFLIYLYTSDCSTSSMSRIANVWGLHVHYTLWVKFLFEIYMNAWIYLLLRRPGASGRLSFPVVARLWNGVVWSLKVPAAPLTQWEREEREMICLLLERLRQSLQSGVPGWGFNWPSLCIRCASCDEPLKEASSWGTEIAIALHGRWWGGLGSKKVCLLKGLYVVLTIKSLHQSVNSRGSGVRKVFQHNQWKGTALAAHTEHKQSLCFICQCH